MSYEFWKKRIKEIKEKKTKFSYLHWAEKEVTQNAMPPANPSFGPQPPPSGSAASSASTALQYPHSKAALAPSWQGFVHTSMDALILFEACLSGYLHHIPRRPHDRERADLIKSGSCFVYEENASGIKRWTDGMSWSPSRIMGNFLVYRELNQPFPPGEKKRAAKRKRNSNPSGSRHVPSSSQSYRGSSFDDAASTGSSVINEDRNEDRKLVGSLIDSYGFKKGGLIKKTLSISTSNCNHHLICYYTLEDIKSGKYLRPSQHPEISRFRPRPQLHQGTVRFRFPVSDAVDDPAELAGWGEFMQSTTSSSTTSNTRGLLTSPHESQQSHDSQQMDEGQNSRASHNTKRILHQSLLSDETNDNDYSRRNHPLVTRGNARRPSMDKASSLFHHSPNASSQQRLAASSFGSLHSNIGSQGISSDRYSWDLSSSHVGSDNNTMAPIMVPPISTNHGSSNSGPHSQSHHFGDYSATSPSDTHSSMKAENILSPLHPHNNEMNDIYSNHIRPYSAASSNATTSAEQPLSASTSATSNMYVQNNENYLAPMDNYLMGQEFRDMSNNRQSHDAYSMHMPMPIHNYDQPPSSRIMEPGTSHQSQQNTSGHPIGGQYGVQGSSSGGESFGPIYSSSSHHPNILSLNPLHYPVVQQTMGQV